MPFDKATANLIRRTARELRAINDKVEWIAQKAWDLLDQAERGEVTLTPSQKDTLRATYNGFKTELQTKFGELP